MGSLRSLETSIEYPDEPIERETRAASQWLLEEPQYRDWVDAKGSTLLWIYGRRGVGKSTVLAYVVDDLLRSGESYLIGYSFLDGTLNHRDPLADSLESLTHQLIERGTYTGSYGLQSLLTYLRQLESPLRPKAFRSYLRTLFAAIQAQTCTIIVLDGFDAWDWIYARFIEEVERAKKAKKVIRCLFASRRPPDAILPYLRLPTICIAEQSWHRRNLFEFICAKLLGSNPRS